MIEIKDYTAEYEDDLYELDSDMYERIAADMGFVEESACVALVDGEFAGAGLLKITSDCFVDIEYKAARGLDEETEVNVSAALIDDLGETFRITILGEGDLAEDEADDAAEEEFDSISEDDDFEDEDFDPYDLTLRTFCPADSEDYRSFLEELGYTAARTLIRMEWRASDKEGQQELMADGEDPRESEKLSIAGRDYRIIYLNADNLDDEAAAHYMISEASAFDELPGEEDFSFRMNRPGTNICALIYDDVIAAAATICRDETDKHGILIDRVFCDEDFRGQGLAGALMTHILRLEAAEGINRAGLSVFADNTRAIGLYRRLGFKVKSKYIEMHKK